MFAKNQEISRLLYQIALYLEMEAVSFRSLAYQKAAFSIETLEEDIEDIYRRDSTAGLEKIPGVGKGLAKLIDEYFKTNKVRIYELYRKSMPIKIDELMAVEGIGPKTIKELYQNLKVKNLADLGKAAKAGKIRKLPNFGEKTEANIIESIEFLKRSQGRFLLGTILPVAEEIYERLSSFKEVEKISLAGSVRRMKETIGDVDFLVVSKNPQKVMDFFTAYPGIEKVWSKGSTKSSVRTKEGFDMDIRVVPKESYGSALQYFTGSKEHNIVLRKIAINKGLKLNEYGVFKGKKLVAGKSEEEIYHLLGMEFIPPELRENQGEVEAAIANKLPKLVELADLKGDLHCHSSWDGGENSIKEMALFAKALGYEYLGISDHTKFLRIENGLDEKKLLEQHQEINKLNQEFERKKDSFRILHGCEANILADGSIDINDETLAQLDYVIAGVHSQLKMEKDRMTERIIKAMRNPNVDIISHPTGRLLKRRDEYEADFNSLLAVARETGTVLEINSSPERLDLNDKNIRKAKDMGVKMVINTDAHEKNQTRFAKYGVSQARRGWLEKGDVVNTQPVKTLQNSFKHN